MEIVKFLKVQEYSLSPNYFTVIDHNCKNISKVQTLKTA